MFGWTTWATVGDNMRGTTSIEAFGYFKQGVQIRKLPLTQQRFEESTKWFKKAIKTDTGLTFNQAKDQDKGYARAWSWMAYGFAMACFEGWEGQAGLDKAVEYAQRSVNIDQFDYQNHWVASIARLINGEPTVARGHLDKALELCEEDLNMGLRNEMADIYVWLGEPDMAIDLIKQTRRISDWNHWSLAWAYYFKAMNNPDFYDKALEELDKTYWQPGQEPYELDIQLLAAAIHAQQAALHTANGETDQANAKTIMANAALELFKMEKQNWTITNEQKRMPFAPEAQALSDHWVDGLTKLNLAP